MRNATVPGEGPASKRLNSRHPVGSVAKLFDGSERVVSVDALHWYNRAVSSP